MESNYKPIAYDEVMWYAKQAKNMRQSDVEMIQRFLMMRAMDVGVESPEVKDSIYRLTDRFVEEELALKRDILAEETRRRGTLSQEIIEVSDDQIVQAIKWTLSSFQSDWDWGGIYIILVCLCNHLGFSAVKTKFVERMAQMGVYPQDNVVRVDHVADTAIKGTEWYEHRFSYLALQRGVKPSWPKTWNEWLNSEIQTNDFIARRDIAKLILKNLRRAIEEDRMV